MNGMERLAHAERDAVDLHAALAADLRTLIVLQVALTEMACCPHCLKPVATCQREPPAEADGAWAVIPLRELEARIRRVRDVLERTSQPDPDELETPAARLAEIERARTPGGYAV